jgi:replication-associated recombination protein RarA
MFLKDIILPKSQHDFIINKDGIVKINKLFNKDFIPNLYIYGPPGCGKYTLFIKNLEIITNKSEIKINFKTINISNQWAHIKEIVIPSSDYHFEINLSKYSNNRNNLFSIIETLTESREISSNFDYKIILIRNIHVASIEFVKFIKQKAESLIDHVRFIVIGTTNSNNMSTLNGVFLTLRVPSPSIENIKDTIISLKKNKEFKYSKRDLNKINLDELINENYRNLHYIFNKLEMLLLNNNFYKSRLDLTVQKICKLLIDKKLSNLIDIRNALYEYQINNEDFNLLLKNIFDYLSLNCNILNTDKKMRMIKEFADSNHKLQKSYKEIVHIEALFFKFFAIIHKT